MDYRYKKTINLKVMGKLDTVAHSCNQKVEAEILLQVKLSLKYIVRPCLKY